MAKVVSVRKWGHRGAEGCGALEQFFGNLESVTRLPHFLAGSAMVEVMTRWAVNLRGTACVVNVPCESGEFHDEDHLGTCDLHGFITEVEGPDDMAVQQSLSGGSPRICGRYLRAYLIRRCPIGVDTSITRSGVGPLPSG